MKLPTFTWPDGAYALRLILAAMLAYGAAQALGFEHGYSAVFSAIIVTRPYAQGAIKAGLLRLLATATGILMAFVAVWLKHTGLNDYELLLAALIPLSILAAWDQSYRTSLISALILLSASTGAPDLKVAALRAIVVTLGAVIGIVVSMIVLPQRHDHVVGRKAARVVKDMLAQLKTALNPHPDFRRDDAVDRRVRKVLLEIGQAAKDHKPGKDTEHDSAKIVGVTRRIQSLCILIRSHWRTDMTPEDRAAREAVCDQLITGSEPKAVIGAIRRLPPLGDAAAPEPWLLESLARDLIALDAMTSKARATGSAARA
ncbi:FUSC family protein [Asticcacaulis solisilvae]|uniref:FUSC family protein n=1 Tax=Asticcacaulis solisilvae TaxID=1217274 RepID=UPI003FD6E53D